MPSTRRVNSRAFYAIHIISYLALSFGIVGGINQTHVNNSHDTTSGTHYRSGCVVLILIAFILLCIITVISATRLRAASGGDGLLVYAGLASIPFFLVRIVYGFLTAFAPQSKAFSWRNPSVIAMAFMQFLMEIIICTLYLVAGVVVPPLKGVQTTEGPNEGANWVFSVLKRQAKPSLIYNGTSRGWYSFLWVGSLTLLQLQAILTLLTSQQTLLRAGWNTVQFPPKREDALSRLYPLTRRFGSVAYR